MTRRTATSVKIPHGSPLQHALAEVKISMRMDDADAIWYCVLVTLCVVTLEKEGYTSFSAVNAAGDRRDVSMAMHDLLMLTAVGGT